VQAESASCRKRYTLARRGRRQPGAEVVERSDRKPSKTRTRRRVAKQEVRPRQRGADGRRARRLHRRQRRRIGVLQPHEHRAERDEAAGDESPRPTRVHAHAIAPAIAAPARMTAVASRDRNSNAAASSTDPISIVWRTTITIVAATTASAAIPDGTTLVVGRGRSPARTTAAAHAI